MTIRGFTMVRNAGQYHFPIKESILSILPIVDEFVVALGDSTKDDQTEALIRSIDSEANRLIYFRQSLLRNIKTTQYYL